MKLTALLLSIVSILFCLITLIRTTSPASAAAVYHPIPPADPLHETLRTARLSLTPATTFAELADAISQATGAAVHVH